mmetsp:Transcript_5744/g.21851  ORF Transcript_5744/g.21851 Transcript_5744/m.21851 type:complete len:213 (-) Transcript_5744:1116-1754(-)
MDANSVIMLPGGSVFLDRVPRKTRPPTSASSPFSLGGEPPWVFACSSFPPSPSNAAGSPTPATVCRCVIGVASALMVLLIGVASALASASFSGPSSSWNFLGCLRRSRAAPAKASMNSWRTPSKALTVLCRGSSPKKCSRSWDCRSHSLKSAVSSSRRASPRSCSCRMASRASGSYLAPNLLSSVDTAMVSLVNSSNCFCTCLGQMREALAT